MGSLKYREVTGYFTARIPDSGDADLNPDTVPLTGNVTFHPEYRKPLVFPGEHIVLEPINAIIIDGHLMVEVIQGEDAVLQALHLPVTMDERANQKWSWVMRFHGMTLGQYGEEVSLPERRFPVEDGDGPLDLSDVAGTWSGGTLITRGEPGPGLTDITAENGEIVFAWDNGRTTVIDVPEAVPGPPGPPGVEVAGGRVMAGDTMIYGNTGWVDITHLLASGSVTAAEVCRENSQVRLRTAGLTRESTDVPARIGPLPVGFRPGVTLVLPVSRSHTAITTIEVGEGGYVEYRWVQGSDMWAEASWLTSEPWPEAPNP